MAMVMGFMGPSMSGMTREEQQLWDAGWCDNFNDQAKGKCAGSQLLVTLYLFMCLFLFLVGSKIRLYKYS